jgi:HSP20 family protein
MGNFHKEFDFGIDFDRIIDAAKEFGAKFKDMAPEFQADWFSPCGCRESAGSGVNQPRWYAYPPTNSYVDSNDSLVMEFALAGIDESAVSISFQGDFLVLDARLSGEKKTEGELRYSRHGFRPRDLRRQKYLVPAEDYAQEKARAVLKYGLLTVTIPAKEFPEGSGVKVEIVKEGN